MKVAKVDDDKKKLSKINAFPSNQVDHEQIFGNMDNGVCIIDEYGYIKYINPAYEKLFMTEYEKIIGKSLFMIKMDEITLQSFKKKKNMKGSLDYYIGNNQLKAATTVIKENNRFKGILVIYEKYELNDNNKMIKINDDMTTGKNNNIDNKEYNLDKPFHDIVGESTIFKKALYRAQRASYTDSTVLIRGESGTGKELVARAIHKNSSRKGESFITINCGAIPSNLIESELFGHEKGAFTGAVSKKIGKFERADGGTIFLDEIGDLPHEMQVKLLRVLQEKEFNRVGGNEGIITNVRIISATNRDLEEMINTGEFREDLYYRLNVIPINLPALRERKFDIFLLLNHFSSKICNKVNIDSFTFTDEAIVCFEEYDWPGNVRELENVIERLIVLSDNNIIDTNDLPSSITKIYGFRNNVTSSNSLINLDNNGELATLEDYEKEIIRYAIKKFGSFNAAGKALGITHKTVAYKARKYNIVD